jgi:uncharacterized protein YndB with AHSA1/START domain
MTTTAPGGRLRTMFEFTIETEIARPAGEVFAHITDPGQLTTWQATAISSVPETPGPLRLGSRLREVHRGPRGKEFDSLVEVVAYEPGRLFELHVVEGYPIHARIELAPSDAGTVMRFTAHGEMPGGTTLLEPVVRRALQRQFRADCLRLKRMLERGHRRDGRWPRRRKAAYASST